MMLPDDCILNLLAVEEKRHRLAVQLLKEKLAYNLGRKRFMEKQAADLMKTLRRQDVKEARP